jgi:ATP-dependent DNA ligase
LRSPYGPFSFTQQIGTGFSDEDLEKFAEFFKDKIISKPRPYYRYSDQVEPDVWVRINELVAAPSALPSLLRMLTSALTRHKRFAV